MRVLYVETPTGYGGSMQSRSNTCRMRSSRWSRCRMMCDSIGRCRRGCIRNTLRRLTCQRPRRRDNAAFYRHSYG